MDANIHPSLLFLLKLQIAQELRKEEETLTQLESSCVTTESEALHKATQLLLGISTSFASLSAGDYDVSILKEVGEEKAERAKIIKLFHVLCLKYMEEVRLRNIC
jgi:hypothetical protein